jgi:repressor LexA
MRERIRKIRKEKDLSQTAFGAKIGVTLGVIKNLEQGKTTLCSPLLELMCSIYNVNETWLRTGKGEMFLETQETPLLDNLKKEYNLSLKAIDILENFLKLSDKEQDEFIGLAEKVFNTTEKDTDKKVVQLTEVKKKETIIEISPKTIEVPIYTPTAAGFGHYADNEIIGYKEVAAEWVDNFEDYCIVRVDGDSMSPKFNDNDLLLIKNQDSVDSGTIAVVLVDGEKSFVKRVIYENDWIELVSINPEYPPIRFEGKDVERVRVFGTVERCI